MPSHLNFLKHLPLSAYPGPQIYQTLPWQLHPIKQQPHHPNALPAIHPTPLSDNVLSEFPGNTFQNQTILLKNDISIQQLDTTSLSYKKFNT